MFILFQFTTYNTTLRPKEKNEIKFEKTEQEVARRFYNQLDQIPNRAKLSGVEINKKDVDNLKALFNSISKGEMTKEKAKKLLGDIDISLILVLSADDVKVLQSIFDKLGYDFKVEFLPNDNEYAKAWNEYFSTKTYNNITEKETEKLFLARVKDFFKYVYLNKSEEYEKWKQEKEKGLTEEKKQESKEEQQGKPSLPPEGVSSITVIGTISPKEEQGKKEQGNVPPTGMQLPTKSTEEEQKSITNEVSVDESISFYTKMIQLDKQKMAFFVGNTAFGNTEAATKGFNTFNTSLNIQNLKKYLPPAIAAKLKQRPGVDKESIKETEWKDIKTEWKDSKTESVKTWEFKVNGKDHTLSLTISQPNEKGYRNVSLVFK